MPAGKPEGVVPADEPEGGAAAGEAEGGAAAGKTEGVAAAGEPEATLGRGAERLLVPLLACVRTAFSGVVSAGAPSSGLPRNNPLGWWVQTWKVPLSR